MRASLILCAVVLSAFAQEPPAAPVNCYLEGRVINAANGEPVRNARLILSHADNPEGGAGSRAGFTTTTDDKGRFAMKDVEPGKYQFSASRGGFAESEYGARRPGRPGTTLSLESGQQLTGLVFRLTPHAVIAGRILDEDGEPMARVLVSAARYRYSMGERALSPVRIENTDDLGDYRLFGLAPGHYILEARDQRRDMRSRANRRVSGSGPETGYVTTYYPGTTDMANAATVEVGAGDVVRGIDFALSKTRTVHVRGRVSYPPQPGGPNIMVALNPRGSRNRNFPTGRSRKLRTRTASSIWPASRQDRTPSAPRCATSRRSQRCNCWTSGRTAPTTSCSLWRRAPR